MRMFPSRAGEEPKESRVQFIIQRNVPGRFSLTLGLPMNCRWYEEPITSSTISTPSSRKRRVKQSRRKPPSFLGWQDKIANRPLRECLTHWNKCPTHNSIHKMRFLARIARALAVPAVFYVAVKQFRRGVSRQLPGAP